MLPRLLALAAVLAAAPASAQTLRVEPFTGLSGDTDGNDTWRAGVRADAQVAEPARLGIEVARRHVADDFDAADANEVALNLSWRLHPALRLSAAVGFLAVEEPGGGTHPTARGRLRWASSPGGARAEIRFERQSVVASPALLRSGLQRTEGRVAVEAPVAGPLRVSGVAGAATFDGRTRSNGRTTFGGGILWRLSPTVTAGAMAHRSGFDAAAEEPYFAPRRADVVEGVLTAEMETDRAYFAMDLGAGAQHVEAHGGESRSWGRALRLWTMASWSLRPGLALRGEAEVYDSALGAPRSGADLSDPATDLGWRHAAVSVGLEWTVES